MGLHRIKDQDRIERLVGSVPAMDFIISGRFWVHKGDKEGSAFMKIGYASEDIGFVGRKLFPASYVKFSVGKRARHFSTASVHHIDHYHDSQRWGRGKHSMLSPAMKPPWQRIAEVKKLFHYLPVVCLVMLNVAGFRHAQCRLRMVRPTARVRLPWH